MKPVSFDPVRIVAEALAAARDPEYGLIEDYDYDDARTALSALASADMLKNGYAAELPIDTDGATKQAWLDSLERLLFRAGMSGKDVKEAMREAAAVFDKSERLTAIQALNETGRLIRIGRDALGIDSGQAKVISDLIDARAHSLSVVR